MNAIVAIHPYRQEPFMSGADAILDRLFSIPCRRLTATAAVSSASPPAIPWARRSSPSGRNALCLGTPGATSASRVSGRGQGGHPSHQAGALGVVTDDGLPPFVLDCRLRQPDTAPRPMEAARREAPQPDVGPGGLALADARPGGGALVGCHEEDKR